MTLLGALGTFFFMLQPGFLNRTGWGEFPKFYGFVYTRLELSVGVNLGASCIGIDYLYHAFG